LKQLEVFSGALKKRKKIPVLQVTNAHYTNSHLHKKNQVVLGQASHFCQGKSWAK
jgi:hypothetical protein